MSFRVRDERERERKRNADEMSVCFEQLQAKNERSRD